MIQRNELKIGLAVVLAGVLFYTGTRFLRDLPLFGKDAVYYTELSNSSGLVRGNIVAVNGVGVGSITEVQLTLTGTRISFSVTEDVILTEGTTASTVGFGLVSSVQLNLSLGPPDAPVYESGAFIPASEQSDILTDLADRAPDVLNRVDTVLAGSSTAITAATRMLTRPEGQMQQTLSSIRTSAIALQAILMSEQGSIRTVLRDITSLSNTLDSFTEDSLSATVSSVKEATDRLAINLMLLEITTQELNTLLSSINRGEGTLGKLATDDSLYIEMQKTMSALRRILENFEEDPKQYLEHMKLVEIF